MSTKEDNKETRTHIPWWIWVLMVLAILVGLSRFITIKKIPTTAEAPIPTATPISVVAADNKSVTGGVDSCTYTKDGVQYVIYHGTSKIIGDLLVECKDGDLSFSAAPVAKPASAPAANSNSFWGSAGAAPQSLDEAVTVLGLTPTVKPYVTGLNPAPGDVRFVGWVVGTHDSAANSTKFTVSLPAGTTVDYDPGVSTLTGKTTVVVNLAPGWNRAMMAENGTVTSLKVTVYWTPFSVGTLPYTIVSGTLPK